VTCFTPDKVTITCLPVNVAFHEVESTIGGSGQSTWSLAS
jgi:hypothetical protein